MAAVIVDSNHPSRRGPDGSSLMAWNETTKEHIGSDTPSDNIADMKIFNENETARPTLKIEPKDDDNNFNIGERDNNTAADDVFPTGAGVEIDNSVESGNFASIVKLANVADGMDAYSVMQAVENKVLEALKLLEELL